MKKFYTLSFLFLCSTLHTFGTVRTVSNHSALGSQYSTLLAAFTAAADGDTLLLEGTDIPYEFGSGAQYWTKNLTVVGIGINSQKDNHKKSIIHGTWSGIFKISGLGSRFYGIVFETVIDGRNSSNLSFYNCLFKQPVVFQSPGPNCSFVNSVFESTDDDIQVVSDAQSPISLISCIVNGSIVDYNLYPEDHPWSIESCLFLFSGRCVSTLLVNSTIENSIFMNSSDPFAGHVNTISHNIFRLAVNLTSNCSGCQLISNLDNTNPNFVNYTPGNLYSPTDDYHIYPTSPAKGAGVGGVDIGPHGSATNFSETGEVLINPIVRSLINSTPNIAPGGTLNIEIHATNPNDH